MVGSRTPQESVQAKSPPSKREKKPSRLQHFRGFVGCRTIRLMVREFPANNCNTTLSQWIKTTASSPLEKFASDCLNQNGNLSQVA